MEGHFDGTVPAPDSGCYAGGVDRHGIRAPMARINALGSPSTAVDNAVCVGPSVVPPERVTDYNLGMKREAAEILKDALARPPEVRAALAGSLLDSFDTDIDEDTAATWAAEVNRRVAELDSGRTRRFPGPRFVADSPLVGFPARRTFMRTHPHKDGFDRVAGALQNEYLPHKLQQHVISPRLPCRPMA